MGKRAYYIPPQARRWLSCLGWRGLAPAREAGLSRCRYMCEAVPQVCAPLLPLPAVRASRTPWEHEWHEGRHCGRLCGAQRKPETNPHRPRRLPTAPQSSMAKCDVTGPLPPFVRIAMQLDWRSWKGNPTPAHAAAPQPEDYGDRRDKLRIVSGHSSHLWTCMYCRIGVFTTRMRMPIDSRHQTAGTSLGLSVSSMANRGPTR